MPYQMKPVSVIKANLGLDTNGKVQRFFQSTCYKHMDKYVPFKEGNLRITADLSNPYYIVYEVPYALYQYYGVRKDGTRPVNHYTTPGTGPYWDKRMVSAEMQDIVNEVQDFISYGGK